MFLKREAKNLKEYKTKKKYKIFNPTITFILHDDGILFDKDAMKLRKSNEELILKNFKKVVL